MKTIGAEVILQTVQVISRGDYELFPQDNALASQAPKIFTDDAQVDFDQPTKAVYDFIRGMSPVPGAWTTLDEKVVKIYSAEVGPASVNQYPGKILTDQKSYLDIATRDGSVRIKYIQMEGKRVMDVRTFLNGYTVKNQAIRTSVSEPS